MKLENKYMCSKCFCVFLEDEDTEEEQSLDQTTCPRCEEGILSLISEEEFDKRSKGYYPYYSEKQQVKEEKLDMVGSVIDQLPAPVGSFEKEYWVKKLGPEIADLLEKVLKNKAIDNPSDLKELNTKLDALAIQRGIKPVKKDAFKELMSKIKIELEGEKHFLDMSPEAQRKVILTESIKTALRSRENPNRETEMNQHFKESLVKTISEIEWYLSRNLCPCIEEGELGLQPVFRTKEGTCHSIPFNSKQEVLSHWLSCSDSYKGSNHEKLLVNYIEAKRTLGQSDVTLERCPACNQLSLLGNDKYAHRKVCEKMTKEARGAIELSKISNTMSKTDSILLRALTRDRTKEQIEESLNS